MRRPLAAALTALFALAACGNDGPAASAAPTTTAPPTSLTETRPTVPEGDFVAVVTQNRTDVVENRFQIQLANRTHDQFQVVAAQLEWDGFTSDRIVRDPPTYVVGGQRVDIPAPFPGANCVGDFTVATMPSLDDARVVVELVDGTTRELPVVDEWFIARRLYEEDCERQMIESQVVIEWVGLHEEDFEGRPVTAAELTLTRRAGVGEFVLLDVGNTIPYAVDPFGTQDGDFSLTLPAGADQASTDVRLIEHRCDPHALADVKQPTNFAVQLRFPDGSEHTYIAYPDRDYWTTMRSTADRACEELGMIVRVGQPGEGHDNRDD